MMKKIVIAALFFITVMLPITAFADIGIGGVAGYSQPTGVTFKIDNFPVVSLGWSINGNWISGTIDYWFLNDKLAKSTLWFAGVGVKTSIGDSIGLTFRVPLGIQWYFMPGFELFGELAPGFAILPATNFDFSGGIGIRFHFN